MASKACEVKQLAACLLSCAGDILVNRLGYGWSERLEMETIISIKIQEGSFEVDEGGRYGLEWNEYVLK